MGRGRIRIGSRTPLARIDDTSSSRSPSEFLGWFGSGSIAESGTIFPTGASWRAASSSTKWVSWRILTCIGKPRLRPVWSAATGGNGGWAGSDTAENLLGEPGVLIGTGRFRGEAEDGFAVGRTLFPADPLGDAGVETPASKYVSY